MNVSKTSDEAPKKPPATLFDLPGEILTQIAEYVFHPLAPSGRLRKIDKRDWNPKEGLTYQEWLQVFDDYTRELIINLNFLYINKKFYRTGIDVLYAMNTLRLTSRELVDISRKPGLVNFLRRVQIRERVLGEGIWTGFQKSKVSQEEGKAVVKKILQGDRLKCIAIDIEPFFIDVDETNPEALWECHRDGLQRCMRAFGISDVAQWRCIGVAEYIITAKPESVGQITGKQLAKLELRLPKILSKWSEAQKWSPNGEFDVRWLHWLPPLGPFDPAWFRVRSTIRQMRRPRHRLLDWLFSLTYDTRQMDDTKRAVYTNFMRQQVPSFALEGGQDEGGEGLLPGRCCSHADHIWTVIFASRRIDAYNMDLVESEVVARTWMLD